MTRPEGLDPGLAAYLTSNRDFLAPAVEAAVAALDLPRDARVLDAGTGAGGALPPLARAAGRVHGVDLNPAALALAVAHADRARVTDRVEVAAGDVRDVLRAARADPERGFDAIWASDVVWPGNFADPAELVAEMARALRPGGTVALFYANYYAATFLPGHPRLAHAARAASERRWNLPAGGSHHQDRHLAWLAAAGLVDVRLRVFPRVATEVRADVAALTYLEETVWPEMRESVAHSGAAAGLTGAELIDLETLLAPGSGGYVVDEPGFFVVHPTLLATGRRPG